MANRFARKIKSGEIGSIGALKSEFRDLAKRTHPDVRGGASAEFAAARSEFEAALRDFEKHRFGARGAAERRGDAGGRGAGGPESGNDRNEPISEEAWACLALLLKRGFPKTARHEKELLRYDYARWRLSEALGAAHAEQFDRFESELLDLKTARSVELDAVIGLIRALIEYREAGLSPMRTDVLLSLGRLRADPGFRPDARAFVDGLARDLGIGGEIGR